MQAAHGLQARVLFANRMMGRCPGLAETPYHFWLSLSCTSSVCLIPCSCTCARGLPFQGAANNKGVFTTVVSFVPGGGTVFMPDAPAVMDEINGNTIEGALTLAQVCLLYTSRRG